MYNSYLVDATGGGNSAFHNIHNDYLHIVDPNERRRLALAEIDKADFGWNHVRAIVVAGAGFFTDSYDIFAINAVTILLGLVYYDRGVMPTPSQTAVKIATPVGTVFGQIVFGYLADRYGRKKMYGIELIIIIVTTVAQSLLSKSRALNLVGIVIFWRLLMGVGVGGDYPLSAIITSEFATTKWRGAMIGSVFAMQGFGQFSATLVSLIITQTFKGSLKSSATPQTCSSDCALAADKMWRIITGFGALPGCLALYYRITIPETPRYTFDVARDILKAESDVSAYMDGKRAPTRPPDELQRSRAMQRHANELRVPRPSFADFREHFGAWQNGKLLLGTSLSWFFLDIAFYGLGLNNNAVLQTMGFAGTENVFRMLQNVNIGMLIIICAGSIPGYWFTVMLVDIMGRKNLQLLGFTMLTTFFLIIGFAFDDLSRGAFLALYIMSQFFFNFGPNATTFIYPGELFPTRYRALAHGISAAAGKLGAITALAFDPLRSRGATANCNSSGCSPWLDNIMKIFALFMFCGLLSTFLLPETARRSLEDITIEHGHAVTSLKSQSHHPSYRESASTTTSAVMAPPARRFWEWRPTRNRQAFRMRLFSKDSSV
ncbi:hypothetical protein FGG08_002897 [Glutinoglossum americanum]|uniref:Major facilitator superfamily (MFS) profile domain-containing protein n=1 Tax=Glutinoglossum americanum TaxID=1670608 RepID=A0A9P8I8D8_9PEZI|nr:hypothetical protein FGG08_002897 [Glutinoglossum americanum]